MGTLVEDLSSGANWISKALQASGYRANFAPESLWEIDRFFDEHSPNGTPKPGGLLSADLGQRRFALGAYMGEVVRPNRGGEWVADDSDPNGEISVELVTPDGTRMWPVQRAMKRLRNGPEDGIAAWGSGIGLEFGPRTDRS